MYLTRSLAIAATLLLVASSCSDGPTAIGPETDGPLLSLGGSAVVNTLDDDDDGVCDDVHCSLREAVASVTPGGEITFGVRGTIETDALTIGRDLTITGPASGEPVIIRPLFTGIEIQPGRIVRITHLTISRGNSSEPGGGIVNRGTLTLANCVVSNNTTSAQGGGIATFGELTATDCTITGNRAQPASSGEYTGEHNGGGIATRGAGLARLIRTSVSQNEALDWGGGVEGRVIAIESSITRNSARIGGGIFGDGQLVRTTVFRNHAHWDGGGIYGGVSLLNSTVSGNSATFDGGGIRNEGAGNYVNSTIVANSASLGGGIIGGGTLLNTLVAGNIGDGRGDDVFDDESLTATHSLIGSSEGHNITDGINGNIVLEYPDADELRLGPLANNGGPTPTHALLPGSPALDAGTANGCPTEDQRGIPRPQGAACDIGAFELEVSPPPPICTPIQRVAVWSNGASPGTIRLADSRVFVAVHDVEDFLDRSAQAQADDVRIGETWETGTPAHRFSILDLNRDGRRDVRVEFRTRQLVEAGHLSPATTEITVWGLDRATDTTYCGTLPVTVVP